MKQTHILLAGTLAVSATVMSCRPLYAQTVTAGARAAASGTAAVSTP